EPEIAAQKYPREWVPYAPALLKASACQIGPRREHGAVDDPRRSDLVHQVELPTPCRKEVGELEFALDGGRTLPEHRAVFDPPQFVHEEAERHRQPEEPDRRQESLTPLRLAQLSE